MRRTGCARLRGSAACGLHAALDTVVPVVDRPRMDNDLRLELLRRVELDQQARNALTPLFKGSDRIDADDPEAQRLMDHNAAVDSDNTAWLRGIVNDRGWPTMAMVGHDGESAAWLLVQHADQDPSFQRRCLALMTAAPEGEVNARHVAYLTDRVRLANGEPQIYGTQVHLDAGSWQPRNLADPDHVDDRRLAVGLEPLTEYLSWFDKPDTHR